MKFYWSTLFLTISLFSFSQGRVDGFYKGKGNFDGVVGVGFESNPNYFAGPNKIALSRDILIGSLYGAYGIANNFDVNVSLPFISVNGVESGIQDVSVFLKFKIGRLTGPNVKIDVSLAGGFSSNITDYQTEGGSAIGQQAKILDIRPVIHTMWNNGMFVTVQSGYSYKFDPTPHSVPVTVKVGKASGKYYVDLWYDYQNSLGGLDYSNGPAPSTFKELGVDYHKVGGTYYRPLKDKLGIFGGVSYTTGGRNTSEGIGVNVGIVFKHYKK